MNITSNSAKDSQLIKLWVLRGRGYSGLSNGPYMSPQCLYKREARRSKKEEDHVTTEAGEEGWKVVYDHRPRNEESL